jgi:hypothetical protein
LQVSTIKLNDLIKQKRNPGRPTIAIRDQSLRFRALLQIGANEVSTFGHICRATQTTVVSLTNFFQPSLELFRQQAGEPGYLGDVGAELSAVYLHVRGMEVTDEVTHMAIELIHRLDVRSEKQVHREWLADLERVDGKMQILVTIMFRSPPAAASGKCG